MKSVQRAEMAVPPVALVVYLLDHGLHAAPDGCLGLKRGAETV